MKKYLYILAGGAAGAILRFLIKKASISEIAVPTFPWGTFIANLSGAFLLAFFLRWAFDSESFSESIHVGVAPGFLGALTTFSTLCKESSLFILEGDFLLMAGYLIASILFGLAFAWFGFYFSGYVREKIFGKVEAKV